MLLKNLRKKKLDGIILNSLNDKKSGFGFDTNKVTIIDKKLKQKKYPLMSKTKIAEIIVEKVKNIFFQRIALEKKIVK